MEKKSAWNKVKIAFKNYRMGDYFRQFSIVAGGVIVTFWGGSLIAEHNRQKEVRAAMELMAEELQHNRQKLSRINLLLDKDIHMSILLVEKLFDPSTIPPDTLERYAVFFSKLSEFKYSTDALEVLKGSSLMQYIPDKRMLQSLLQTYQQLEDTQSNITNYYSMKNEVVLNAILSRNKEQAVELLNSSTNIEGLRSHVAYLMSLPSFVNYTAMVPDFLDWEEQKNLEHRLDEQIGILEKKYGFRVNAPEQPAQTTSPR